MIELKRNEVLSFDDGLLTVKVAGHGQENGWGVLAFHERQSELDADGFHHFELPPSELDALRDFLNRVRPDRATESVLAATREHVARLEVQRDELLKALKAAEGAIDDCQNYRSHLHHRELEQVRSAIAKAAMTAR